MTKAELKQLNERRRKLNNEASLYCQEYATLETYDSVHNAYIFSAEPREKRIAELEAQIEKMKCCENCAWWYKLPNGQRDCAETCENLDNWSLRR